MLCARPAWAGWYEVTYSGGTITRTTLHGVETSLYGDTGGGGYGGGWYVGWGTEAAPDGTTVATMGDVLCEGTITATFTWQSGEPGYPAPIAEDPAPRAVVIKETGIASWNSDYSPNAVPSGSAFNGLGFASQHRESPPDYNRLWQDNTSSGTRYQIKQDPGASFSIACSPSAHFSGTGAIGPPEGSGDGENGVGYKASAEPLEVVLSGGIAGTLGRRKYLIGQHVGATLSTGGLTATSYDWSVSGGEPFKSYSANEEEAHFTPFWGDTTSSIGFYFKRPDFNLGPSTVTCTAHLVVPPDAIPAGGFDVTESRDCGVEKPFNSLKAYIGTTQAVPLTDPSSIALQGAQVSDGTPLYQGIAWIGEVTTPTEFGTDGGWNYTQTVAAHRVLQTPGVTHNNSLNGIRVLDTHFGYAPRNHALYPADGSEQTSGDSPDEPFAQDGEVLTGVQINDSFVTYTLYMPPGIDSAFVPLKNLHWFWHGAASPDNTTGVWSVSGAGSGWEFVADFPGHPVWEKLYLNGQLVGGNIANRTWDPPLSTWDPPLSGYSR